MTFRYLGLLLLFYAIQIHAISPGNQIRERFRSNGINPELVDPRRGYRQEPLLDMVLIYQGGRQRMDWTPDEMRPYVVHNNQANGKEWFFDGFLFLEFQDGAGYNYSPGYQGNKEARKQEWEWLSNRLFEDGKAIKALNRCVAEAKEELGEPSFRHKVVVGLPEPFLNQKDWGELNGSKLDFAKREDRIAASLWYIDLIREKFQASDLEHLVLDGFYWVSEQMNTTDFITIEIGEHIRSNGGKFFWIPYYMSNGYSQWQEYGFDVAYLQPNYFFNKKIGEERIRNACELAFTHNMGLEMEFDARALYDSKVNYRDRMINYINTFRELDVFKNASIAYYEGGGAMYQFAQSSNPGDRELMDQLHSLVVERRRRLVENVVYRQDFQEDKNMDEAMWSIDGNKCNFQFTEDGLVISSGGSSTRLHSRGKMDMQYGRVELTAKILSNRDDVSIRIHLLPTEEKVGSWPSSGELFLLRFNGKNPGKARVGVNTDRMNETNGKIRESVLSWGTGYDQTHTFVCEWQEKKISFYIDGMKVNIQEDLYDKQYSSYPNFWPFNEKFYFDISIASNSDEPIILIESIKISK